MLVKSQKYIIYSAKGHDTVFDSTQFSKFY